MFGRTKPIDDPVLGPLHRSRGAWRGTLHLEPHGQIELAVPGARSQPDPEALTLARTITADYEQCRPAIARALAEHRATSLGTDEVTNLEHEPPPSSVAIIALDRGLIIQLAYRVEWDDDHTLGACLRDGQLVELNGSILEP